MRSSCNGAHDGVLFTTKGSCEHQRQDNSYKRRNSTGIPGFPINDDVGDDEDVCESDDDHDEADDERTKSDDEEEEKQDDEYIHTPDDYVPTNDETNDESKEFDEEELKAIWTEGVADKLKKKKHNNVDKDEGPSAGSDGGLKRWKISKDTELSKKAKSTKTSKLHIQRQTQNLSQNLLSKSAQAEKGEQVLRLESTRISSELR
ncbi:hypothetical protein Tco_1254881 [Tanacetum coccineum]